MSSHFDEIFLTSVEELTTIDHSSQKFKIIVSKKDNESTKTVIADECISLWDRNRYDSISN